MYLPFAIFSVEMNYYHFDQFFFFFVIFFWGDVFNSLTCLVFLIAVSVLHIFTWEKMIMSVSIT